MRLAMTIFLVSAIAAYPARSADGALVEKSWKIDGVARKALVQIPASAGKTEAPVVFAFHGHGGSMQNSAEKFAYHKLWPDAISVYPQGLPTVGKEDPDGKTAGWQKKPGDEKDRDLKFFDAILASLKKEAKVDPKRIYATGHSNGGGFTYLLWAERGDTFAAVAPSAGASARVFKSLKPLPALHVAGEKDENVAYENQKNTMERVRKLDGCDAEGKPWTKVGSLVGTEYASKTGTPFVSLIHPGTHKFPEDAPPLIVKFFKEHSKK